MKVCVTGATGFIGENLVRHLVAQGSEVVALVRSLDTTSSRFAPEVECRLGNVCDRDSLKAAFDSCDVVIHLAALFNAPEASWEDYVDVNVTGTQNVLEMAKAAGVERVVHCSTVGVACGGNPPYAEDAQYAPPDWDKYETTKCDGEKAAIAFGQANDYPVVIIRPSQVYGPGDLSKLKFYKMVKKGVIVSPGKTLKHLIYIDDLCAAFELACRCEAGFALPMIIASKQPILLSELVRIVASELGVKPPRVSLPQLPVTAVATVVEMVSNALGVKPPIFRRSMNFFTKSVAFEATNAQQYLNFSSQVSTQEGVARTTRWYQDIGKL